MKCKCIKDYNTTIDGDFYKGEEYNYKKYVEDVIDDFAVIDKIETECYYEVEFIRDDHYNTTLGIMIKGGPDFYTFLESEFNEHFINLRKEKLKNLMNYEND